jgi:hypothetical protein
MFRANYLIISCAVVKRPINTLTYLTPYWILGILTTRKTIVFQFFVYTKDALPKLPQTFTPSIWELMLFKISDFY